MHYAANAGMQKLRCCTKVIDLFVESKGAGWLLIVAGVSINFADMGSI